MTTCCVCQSNLSQDHVENGDEFCSLECVKVYCARPKCLLCRKSVMIDGDQLCSDECTEEYHSTLDESYYHY